MTATALLTHLGFALGLVLLSAVLTRVMIAIGPIDTPNHRSAHRNPTPKSGGVAVVLTFIAGMAVVYGVSAETRPAEPALIGFILSAIGIALVSLVDDIRPQSFRFKLTAQTLAAFVVLGFGLVVREVSLPIVGPIDLGWFGYPITWLWIVGLTNAVNFMDGINGLVGGVAMLAAAFLAIFAFYAGSPFVYISALVLAASTAGFLLFNFPAGRIFLGDVGSQFLGFNLAVLGIFAAQHDRGHLTFVAVPVLLLALIIDVIFTLWRRWRAGERLTEAHHGHLYQALGVTGMNRNRVTLIEWGFVLIQAAAIWAYQALGSGRNWVALAAVLLVQMIFLWWVRGRARRAGLKGW